MYRIERDGATIGVTERITFTRLAENGCFAECHKDVAQGFVYAGQVYSLGGEGGYTDHPEATLTEFDGGAAITEMQMAIDDLVVAALMGGIGNV